MLGETILQINMPTKVAFGCGSRRQVGETIKREGWQCVGLVKDEGLREVAAVDELIAEI